MHEMGIANSIFKAAIQELHRYPGHRINKIGVRIGEYAGVDPESLNFCFECLTERTVTLHVEWHAASEDLDLAYLDLEEIAQ